MRERESQKPEKPMILLLLSTKPSRNIQNNANKVKFSLFFLGKIRDFEDDSLDISS